MYTLGIDELVALEEELLNHIRKEIIEINRRGDISDFFELINFTYTARKINDYEKILVVGQSKSKISELKHVAMSKGIDTERFKFIINYEEISQFDFSPVIQGVRYKYVLVGPMGHVQKGSKKSSSMIVELEKQEHLKVFRIENNRGTLELTKTSFARVLENVS